MTTKELVQGKCPRCGKTLNYEGTEWGDESIGFEVDCDCGFAGYEWYKLVFDEFTDEQGVPVEVE